MTVKLRSLRRDSAKDDSGQWIDLVQLEGASLCVRSFNFAAYRVARDLLVQKLQRRYGNKPIPGEVRDAEFGKLYATHIVTGWKGFDEDYSPALALELLSDPEFAELRGYVEWAASQAGEVKAEYLEDAAGNSEPPSAGG